MAALRGVALPAQGARTLPGPREGHYREPQQRANGGALLAQRLCSRAFFVPQGRMVGHYGHLSLEPKSVPPPKRTGWIGRGKCHMEKATIDLKGDSKDLSGRVHQLPYCVKHDSPALFSTISNPNTKVLGEDEGLLLQEAHFRGRLLQGTTLPLPHDYSGFVLSKRSPPTSDENSFKILK
ncbi:hypothetical protein JHK85_000511 [Glycine max]|nr:hypothetical protein JHK85_000511 [Glycine max]KAH1161689.1 hypothetical protein GYH30_000538 [Glycine max]